MKLIITTKQTATLTTTHTIEVKQDSKKKSPARQTPKPSNPKTTNIINQI